MQKTTRSTYFSTVYGNDFLFLLQPGAVVKECCNKQRNNLLMFSQVKGIKGINC